jgi:sphingomyelin phosphodiesterase
VQIAAQVFGHSHRAEFEARLRVDTEPASARLIRTQIAYSDYRNRTAETATSITYVAPALTPSSAQSSS